MDLVEVYRVIYDGPDDYLQGIIVYMDEESDLGFLFAEKDIDPKSGLHPDKLFEYQKVEPFTDAKKKLKMPLIKAKDHIMLNGPTNASISANPCFGLSFYLFGVIYKNVKIEFPLDDDMLSTPLYKVITSSTGNRFLTVLYAIFGNAAEARVEVKFTGVNSAFDLYGVINARTSAIKQTAYSSLLFCKDKDETPEKIEARPKEETFIPLSRPFVAVPLGSELILEIGLHTDNGEAIFEDIVTFPAKKGVPSSKHGPIKCSKGEIIVEVSWRYKSTLDELVEQEKAMKERGELARIKESY